MENIKRDLIGGIETDFFRAKLRWPQGFDGDPEVTVTMKPSTFPLDEMSVTSHDMKNDLEADLFDLCRRIREARGAAISIAMRRRSA